MRVSGRTGLQQMLKIIDHRLEIFVGLQ